MFIILAGTLAAMFLLTRQKYGVSQGMYRICFMLGGAAAIGIVAVPNPWLQALLVLMLFNLLRDSDVGVHLSRALPLFLMMASAVILIDRLGAGMVYPGLILMVGAGLILAVQTVLDYRRQMAPSWATPSLAAGQENVNNTQAISVICTTAALGLTWGFSPQWAIIVPFVALPILLIQWMDWRRNRSVTLGPPILAGVGLLMLPFVIGWWASLSLLVAIPALIWGIGEAYRKPVFWDSGRVRIWTTMLLSFWWNGGWMVRLSGRGWQSWVVCNDLLLQVAKKTKRQAIVNVHTMMSDAHSEYVQILFEHGFVGFVLLAGYILTSLWRLGHGSPEAQAVYILATGVCGVAAVLHNFTWYHNTAAPHPDHPEQTYLYSIGNPALLWLSFLTVCMVEVVK